MVNADNNGSIIIRNRDDVDKNDAYNLFIIKYGIELWICQRGIIILLPVAGWLYMDCCVEHKQFFGGILLLSGLPLQLKEFVILNLDPAIIGDQTVFFFDLSMVIICLFSDYPRQSIHNYSWRIGTNYRWIMMIIMIV